MTQNKCIFKPFFAYPKHWQLPTSLSIAAIALLAFDTIFLLLNIAFLSDNFALSERWALWTDRGYAEWFQYVKVVIIASLLLLLGIKNRSLLYGGFSLLFWLLLFDDSLSIHEQLGDRIGMWLNTEDHVGEAIAVLGISLLPLGLISAAYAIAKAAYKRFALNLVALLLFYAAFGVILDFIHDEVYFPSRTLTVSLRVLEDFGENIAMVLILIFVIYHFFYVSPQLSSRQIETS